MNFPTQISSGDPTPTKPAETTTMCAWQPIETAPRDGTRILLSNGDDIVMAEFCELIDAHGFTETGSDNPAGSAAYLKHYRFWMPLPAPPVP